jgi:predicted phosphohydrolase
MEGLIPMKLIKKPYLQLPEPSGMTIMWETDVPSTTKVTVWKAEAPNIPAKVYYSLYVPAGSPQVFEGDAAKHHKVTVTGLEAGTDYCYQAESMTANGHYESELCVFRTAPASGTPFTFALTAETGGAAQPEHVAPIAGQIQNSHPDLLIALGDVVWDGNIAEEWNDCFFHPYEAILENTPLYHCAGNHEDHSPLMEQLFAFPRYYAFTYSDVHFIALDSTLWAERTFLPDGSSEMRAFDSFNEQDEQYQFLQAELAGSTAIWKIVFFHYPPYSSAIFETTAMRRLTDLFDQYGVDLVFSSHTIHYERSHPLKHGKLDSAGTRYLVVGGSGAYPAWLRHKTNPFTAKIMPKPHFVHVAATPFSLEVQAIDANGMLFDQFTLEKQNNGLE